MNTQLIRGSASSKSSTRRLQPRLRVHSAIATLLSACLLLTLTGAPAAAAPHLQSARSDAIPPGYSSEVIQVKFREGVEVTSPEAALPLELRNSVDGLTRLFSLPEEKLDELRAAAMNRMLALGESKAAQTLPDLTLWFQISLKPGADAAAFIESVKKLENVEIVEPAPLPASPPAVTPDFTAQQGYLEAAPGGIEARYAWLFPGGNASGVTIYDVEYNWLRTHEDLSRASGVAFLLDPGDSIAPPGYDLDGDGVIDCPAPCDSINREHGTAVLGELIADNDTKGVTGISWGANIGLAPVRTANQAYNPANAILLAVAAGSSGDVILIEQQIAVCGLSGSNTSEGPVEWDSAIFMAIQMAVANGFVVVEAAGNGNVNLDQAACLGRFDRSVRDSGAIIVGAGRPPGSGFDRQRETFSSFGSRVDLQGWGSAVRTTGYGTAYQNADDPTNPNFWYVNFNGTSSASPIVAGAVANLQGIARSRLGGPLPPGFVRALLVGTGSPQLGNTAQNIGSRPDLRQAIADLAAFPFFGPLVADLSLTMTDSPDPVIPGQRLTYSISVRNNGPDVASGVAVHDILPSGVTFVSAAASQGSCTQTNIFVDCDLGDLASGATVTVTIVVTPRTGCLITINAASVTRNETDPDILNNAQAETTVVALDSFNRPNGALGRNWRGATGGYRIAGNRLDVGYGGAIFWQPGVFGPDQVACVTISKFDPDSKHHTLMLKVFQRNTVSQGAILVSYNNVTGTIDVEVRDVANEVWRLVGSFEPDFVVEGDQLGARALADGRVQVFLNTILIGTADAGSYYAGKSGQIGLWLHDAQDAILDNFSGGTALP